MRCGKVLLATILCLFLGASSAQGELVEAICNTLAQVIVKDEVTKAFNANSTVAPALLRLHFHDCFVRVGTFQNHHLLQHFVTLDSVYLY